MHPLAPPKLPSFIPGPDGGDILIVIMGVVLIIAVLVVGNIFLRLHSLPEHMAHRTQKVQLQVVAVLSLLSLFTGIHGFWVAGLLLAMIDLPDISGPLRSIAGSVGRIADVRKAGAKHEASTTSGGSQQAEAQASQAPKGTSVPKLASGPHA